MSGTVAVVAQVELAGVGVQDNEAVVLAVVGGQRGLLGRAVAGILRLQEAQAAAGMADAVEVVEDLLDEQLAQVLAGGQPQGGVARLDDGHDHFGQELNVPGDVAPEQAGGSFATRRVERVAPPEGMT